MSEEGDNKRLKKWYRKLKRPKNMIHGHLCFKPTITNHILRSFWFSVSFLRPFIITHRGKNKQFFFMEIETRDVISAEYLSRLFKNEKKSKITYSH